MTEYTRLYIVIVLLVRVGQILICNCSRMTKHSLLDIHLHKYSLSRAYHEYIDLVGDDEDYEDEDLQDALINSLDANSHSSRTRL